MHRIRRAPFLIAAAVILPLLIFLGVQFAFQARGERDEVKAEALEKTGRALVEADGMLQRSLGALDMIGGGRLALERDWRTLYDRLQQLRSIQPGWVTVVVTDLRTGRGVFDLRRPFGSAVDARAFRAATGGVSTARAFVGDMGGSGPGCPCAMVHHYVGPAGSPVFLITIALDPRHFLRMVSRHTDQGRVFGLVDRNGNFVARSLDHENRVGTPSTRFVQDAIRSGRSGIYFSRTWEGFSSYTAYNTSELSGWSAHVAFSQSLLDSPRWRSIASTLIAGFASLLLAVTLVWFTLRELAEGRRVQERLQEAQKMEALGQITGGIAHDFNNLLTPIVGGLGLLARKSELDSGSRRMIESALSASRRAAKLTGQLLAFSRRQKMEIRPVDLQRLLEEIRPLLEQSAGAGIAIHIDLDQDAQCVLTDANQLELALLNLVLNARDAMPEGGNVSISARVEAGRRTRASMITIQVRDSGVGMPRNVLRRATEPFFTTKRAGSGTGLGLAQVYGIVRQSGGSLALDSEPGMGTVVTMTLPTCTLPSLPRPVDVTERVADDVAGQRILLCDDDDHVRIFVARVLDDAGYVVESVSDGRSAVQLIRHSPVGLLLVDFAMHGMNGADVTAAARAFRPNLPVLMITGYADTDAVAAHAPGIPMLRKPFEAEDLLAAVREAMASGSKGFDEG